MKISKRNDLTALITAIFGFCLVCHSLSAHYSPARSLSQKLANQFSVKQKRKLEKDTFKANKSIQKLKALKDKILKADNVKLEESLRKHKEIIARLEKDHEHRDRYLEGKFYGMPVYSEDLTFIPSELKSKFVRQNKKFQREKLQKKFTQHMKDGIDLVNDNRPTGERNLEITEKVDEHGDSAIFQKRFGEIDENYKDEVNKVLENIHGSIDNMNQEKHIMKGMMENQLDRKLDFLYYDFVRISHRIDETQAYLVTLMNNIDQHYDDKEFVDMLDINGKATDFQKKDAEFLKE